MNKCLNDKKYCRWNFTLYGAILSLAYKQLKLLTTLHEADMAGQAKKYVP
jgi:hypothetical protein